ncbi:hypothetical protein BgiMline_032374 [Biomphalaria glabrata]
MSSPYLNWRMIYNSLIRPLKELALERYLMTASARYGYSSPIRGSAKKSRHPDQPLDIILNEQNPNHPAKIFSSTAIVQTRAFSAGTEYHGRYNLGRRHTKSASTPGKYTLNNQLPKTPKSFKRSRSASIPRRTSGGRGRGDQKSPQKPPTIAECSDDASPRIGRDYITQRTDSTSASPIVQSQSVKNHNTNRQENDDVESDPKVSMWPQTRLSSLKKKLREKWIVHSHQQKSIGEFGLLKCFILAKSFKP